MIERYKQGKLVWVDVLKPDEEEIRTLLEEFSLTPEIVKDATATISHAEAICVDGVIRLTMDFPVVKRTDIDHPHNVEFIISGNTLITVRYEDMQAVHKFKKEFEVITLLYKTRKGVNATHLLYALLREFYATLDSKVEYLNSKLSDIDREIFEGHEKAMVFAISELSRKLLSFRQALKPHEEILRVAREHIDTCYTHSATKELTEVYGQYFFLMRRVSALFEALDDLKNTNFALLTTKQNEVMKILTIMAFITFPLSLFTSMFGMNTKTTPIIGLPADFWIIVGIMTVVTIGFFIFFKYKKWI